MLVLSRRPGQSIKIGKDIEITIVNSRTGRVRVGINAPANVPVVRSEKQNAPKST